MIQPCRAVLGHESRAFRFYIRASPIVCAGDALYLLLLALLCFSRGAGGYASNIRYELALRFRGEARTAPGADRKAPDSSTLLRWGLLGTGGILCPTLKLVAMHGIPWTQTWALLYFAGILVGEAAILLAYRLDAFDAEPLPDVPDWRQWRASVLENIAPALAVLVVVLHSLVAAWFFWALAFRIGAFTSIAGVIIMLLLAGWSAFALWTSLEGVDEFPGFGYLHLRGGRFAVVCLLDAAFAAATQFPSPLASDDPTMPTSFVEWLVDQSALLRTPVEVLWVASCFALWASQALLDGLIVVWLPKFALKSRLDRVLHAETLPDCQAAAFFGVVFAGSLVYYSVIYSSRETYNPDWTGVFG